MRRFEKFGKPASKAFVLVGTDSKQSAMQFSTQFLA
jgi:hypothetical protein